MDCLVRGSQPRTVTLLTWEAAVRVGVNSIRFGVSGLPAAAVPAWAARCSSAASPGP